MRTLRLRQLLQFIASLGSLLARLACRRSMPICGRGSTMLGEYPSPLLCATTDAMIIYGIMRGIDSVERRQEKNERSKKGQGQEREEKARSSSFRATDSSAVTFRFSTERNVRRLAVAAAGREAVPAITVVTSSNQQQVQQQETSLEHRCGYFQKDPWVLRLTVWSRAAAPCVESSVFVHLTLMGAGPAVWSGEGLQSHASHAKAYEALTAIVESLGRALAWPCSRVQCHCASSSSGSGPRPEASWRGSARVVDRESRCPEPPKEAPVSSCPDLPRQEGFQRSM
jgi:hypothetical protein